MTCCHLQRYEYTIDAYCWATYNFPKKYIIGLKKIKPDDYLKKLPEELQDSKILTVYRGGYPMETWRDVRKDCSWTINKNVALWFALRHQVFCGDIGTVFQATISRDRIIAYIDGHEQEVIQHCGVKNVIELAPTEDELREAMLYHSKANFTYRTETLPTTEELEKIKSIQEQGIRIVQQDDGDFMILDKDNNIKNAGLTVDDIAESLGLKYEQVYELIDTPQE